MDKAAWSLFEKRGPDPRTDPRLAPVMAFYRDVYPAILKRELGVDSLPREYQEAIADLPNVPVDWVNNGSVSGMALKWPYAPWLLFKLRSREVWLDKARRNLASTYAHELRHMLQGKVESNARNHYNDLYRFGGKNIDNWLYSLLMGRKELDTTNIEHQYRLYDALRNRLKRYPTAEEYMNYIDGFDAKDLYLRERTNLVNDYEHNADEQEGLPTWQDWLKSKEYKDLAKSMDEKGVPHSYSYVKGQGPDPVWLNLISKEERDKVDGAVAGSSISMNPRVSMANDVGRHWLYREWGKKLGPQRLDEAANKFKEAMKGIGPSYGKPAGPREER